MARAGRLRYTEGRLYIASASVALLLVMWAVLAVRDYEQRNNDAVQDQGPGGTQLVPGDPGTLLVAPHTRTRGS